MLHAVGAAFQLSFGPQPHQQTLRRIIAHISSALQALGTAEEKHIAAVTGKSLHGARFPSLRFPVMSCDCTAF
jgi:hypothetical protein